MLTHTHTKSNRLSDRPGADDDNDIFNSFFHIPILGKIDIRLKVPPGRYLFSFNTVLYYTFIPQLKKMLKKSRLFLGLVTLSLTTNTLTAQQYVLDKKIPLPGDGG